MDSKNADLWPISKFHFLVTLKSSSIEGDISFQEVSGLDLETEVVDYRHGDNPNFGTMKKPGLIKTTNVTCKKGVFAKDDRLVTLFNNILTDKHYYSKLEERITVTIKLLDELGGIVMTWELARAFPAKISGTDLKSDASEIAIETMEFAHEGITTAVIV